MYYWRIDENSFSKKIKISYQVELRNIQLSGKNKLLMILMLEHKDIYVKIYTSWTM